MTQDSARYSTHSQTKLQENPARNMTDTKNLLELTRDVDMLIEKGFGMLKQEHILRVDSSNFQAWERRLRLIFDSYLKDPLYLQSGYVGDKKHERFCRAVLLSLVPDSIQDSIITIRPCHAIYTWLKHHYFATTRSSQCVAFNKLLSIEIHDDKAPSSLIMQMNEALTDFKNWSGNLGNDYRPETSDIQPSFNSITMTPGTDSHKSKGHCDENDNATYMSHLQQTRTYGEELSCSSWSKKQHGGTDKPRLQTSGSASSIPCPLSDNHPSHTPPFQLLSSTLCIEGNAPTQPLPTTLSTASDRRCKSLQSVYDTGASHSLTGDLLALCCFRKLTKPITLCVATNTAQQSFVTGVGSLIYPGYNGALVSTGAKLQMIGSDILISTEAEGPLLQATYCGNGRKWQLPLFSRLLACAIDNNDVKLTCSNGNLPKESISTIELPCASISAMHARPKRDLKKTERCTDKLDCKKELLQWHCLFGHIGL
ncbi:hypothetical protein O181_058844 [Austropuccinia psidii MF-1]|uniref:Uncharacterized protein n=1 Tax=Austropuccinia psidii MF-1 TaxID=1389203 RepID=A0A9Q3HY24_9BASI|nr:hypothetical protein [Austropuccinia psidii MF-1]